jgi:hypothetical protein
MADDPDMPPDIPIIDPPPPVNMEHMLPRCQNTFSSSPSMLLAE